MSDKTAATVAHTIGIDTSKNTRHLIGLDDESPPEASPMRSGTDPEPISGHSRVSAPQM